DPHARAVRDLLPRGRRDQLRSLCRLLRLKLRLMRSITRLVSIATVACSSLGLAVDAEASTVTVGSPLYGTGGGVGACPQPAGCATVQLALSGAEALVQSPVDGTVVRWHMEGANPKAGYTLRALRETGEHEFTAVGASDPVTPAGLGIETFAAHMPVH